MSGLPEVPGRNGLLEVAVFRRHAADAERAEAGGADRLQLCANTEDDPRSPEPALVGQVRRVTGLPLRVVLRLREGYGTDGGEMARLQGLLASYRAVGADGVVLGYLNAHTEIDLPVVAPPLLGDANFGWTFSPGRRLLHLDGSCLAGAAPAARPGRGADGRLGPGRGRGPGRAGHPGEDRPVRPVGDHGRRPARTRSTCPGWPAPAYAPSRSVRCPAAGLGEGVRRLRPGAHLAEADRRRGDPERCGPLTVYIDPPTWPGHGRLWSHLVSDVSYAELHAFARLLGHPASGRSSATTTT